MAGISSAVLRQARGPRTCQDMVGVVCDVACRALDVDLIVVALSRHSFRPVDQPRPGPEALARPGPEALDGSESPLRLALRDAGSTFGTVNLFRRPGRAWTEPDRAGARFIADLLASYLSAASTPLGQTAESGDDRTIGLFLIHSAQSHP